jgi:hypothetical protein
VSKRGLWLDRPIGGEEKDRHGLSHGRIRNRKHEMTEEV